MWPFLGYTDLERQESLNMVRQMAKALHIACPEADMVISVVAPIASSRTAFYDVFRDNITEIRFTAILEARPPEYYSTFYEGGPRPAIEGWGEFNTYLEELTK
jgi:hypothetical protein